MLYYLAYGSNLHPVRLVERVPSACLIGVTQLGGHQLRFHKKGKDGSGKCNLHETRRETDVVFGAVYRIASDHKELLDRFEGCGAGYIDRQISAELDGVAYQCFTYQAQESHIEHQLAPYSWYRDLVELGARYLQMPEDYVERISRIEVVEDPELERKAEHESLILRIKKFSGRLPG